MLTRTQSCIFSKDWFRQKIEVYLSPLVITTFLNAIEIKTFRDQKALKRKLRIFSNTLKIIFHPTNFTRVIISNLYPIYQGGGEICGAPILSPVSFYDDVKLGIPCDSVNYFRALVRHSRFRDCGILALLKDMLRFRWKVFSDGKRRSFWLIRMKINYCFCRI